MYLQTSLFVAWAVLVDLSLAFNWDFSNKVQFREAIQSAQNPNITDLQPKFFTELGSKRVRVKYGPHEAPSNKVANGMGTFLDRNATKPCSNCLITWMQADLIYPNGTTANSDTGMWLHHSVAINLGRKDTVCKSSEVSPQRFFASGNERTEVNLSLNGTSKTGYFLKDTDKLMMLIELMNQQPEARDAIMVIDYEYIPGMPNGFTALDSVWLDIGGCANSEQPPTSNAVSEYSMTPAFKMPSAGRIIGLGSHLHDGGTHLEVVQNGKVICESLATYGATPGYIEPMEMGNMTTNMTMPGMPGMANMPGMAMGMVHISNITTCYDTGKFAAGDEFTVRAFYNMTEHPGMVEADGSMSPIMGISIMYVEVTNSTSTTQSGSGSGSNSSSGSIAQSSGGAQNSYLGLSNLSLVMAMLGLVSILI